VLEEPERVAAASSIALVSLSSKVRSGCAP
jgi:hypothetical protein